LSHLRDHTEDSILREIASHVARELKIDVVEEEVFKTLKWHSRFLPRDLREDYGVLVLIETSDEEKSGGTVNKIAFRRICNRVAKRLSYQSQKVADEIASRVDEPSSESGERSVRKIAVMEVLEAMAPESQVIDLMHFIRGQSLEEISNKLEIPLSSLHRKLKKALEQARHLMEYSR
jgi:RNA polymerase sigma factor (sigma-70 family)